MRKLDVDAALAEVASSSHGVVTRRQAEALGMDSRMVRLRLRTGVLREPRPGVLILAASPTSWEQSVMVATAAGWGAVASHRAAARLHGLDGLLSTEAVEVSVRAARRLGEPRGALVHRVVALDRCDVVEARRIPATGLARTLADLGSVVAEDRVRQALDDARRRGVSLHWLDQTARRLHRPGQRGTGTLLRLLDEARTERVAPDSWFERLLERCLAAPDLPPLERQFVVRDLAGRFVARLDAAMPSIRLGFEAHSRRFHFGAGPERADEDRDLRLAALGWEILYLGWQHLRDADALLDVVCRAVAART
jgi:hypothetical protein